MYKNYSILIFSAFQICIHDFTMHADVTHVEALNTRTWWRHKSGHAYNISYRLTMLMCCFFTRILWYIYPYWLVYRGFDDDQTITR